MLSSCEIVYAESVAAVAGVVKTIWIVMPVNIEGWCVFEFK